MSAKWNAIHMGLAHGIAEASKDPSTKVGARIVDPKYRVISEGSNGPPRGVTDNPNISRDAKLRRTIHAERNAIQFAQRDLAGAIMYSTHYPCAQCAAAIVQAEIAEVVTHEPNPEFAARWADDIAEAASIFAEAGVTVTIMPKQANT